jgi:predicted RNase H-like HicB family nuclease
MRKINKVEPDTDLLDEYDFSKLKRVRGAYAGRPVSHNFTIELVRKDDECWLAEVPAFALQVFGQTREEVISKAQGQAFRVLAERIEQGKTVLGPASISFSISE